MASSYLAVGDRIKLIDDGELLVFVHLLLRHAEASGRHGRSDLIESLQNTLNTYGAGVIDLPLDATVADPSRKSHFLGLLDAMDRELDQIGEAYPLALLKKGWLTRGVRFNNDYKTVRIRSAVSTVRDLVKSA
jgi:hypothetical protein